FTNNASYTVNWANDAAAANAFFNANFGVVTQAIGSFSWVLTNSCVLGRDPGTYAQVYHVGGALRVTNSAGNALLEIRRGEDILLGGVVEADRLLLTNNAGLIEFGSGGTLITRGGVISNGSSF